MQKLKTAKLFRNELIPVSGKLVERYNKCLVKLGFEPTSLTNFSVDGVGWSPEIAEEKKNVNYLNHGDANSHGILISPLQKNKPVYLPFHSFDRDMMQMVFKTHEETINNITRDSAICLDFDQDIDAFYEPLDILKYEWITVNFHLIDNLDTQQQEQFNLIKEFKSENNFIDEDLHQKLLDSAKKYGDLRDRKLSIEPVLYKTNSFYTKAFGGIYVLRDFITPILVFEDIKSYKEAIKDTIHDVLLYHISHSQLMEKLRDHVIIECDLEDVVKSTRYDRIKKFEFTKQLKHTNHPIKEILSNNVLFKSYQSKIDIKALKKVNGVEIYLERLERSNAFKIQDLIDEKFYYALHQPHSSLDPKHQDLLWKLIVNVSPKDVLFLYWYDKEAFYKMYNEWDDSMKDWVIETIRNNI